jgi:hypothetical protein
MRSSLGCLGVAALLAACGTSPSAGDSGETPDSGTGADSGTPPDAGTANDAGSNADSGNDAGTSDAGPSDAGGCSYRYCEGFESYPTAAVANAEALGPWKATVNGIGIQARLDGLNPHSGLQSFHITVLADAGSASAHLTQKDGGGVIPGNDLFGRAWVFYTLDGGYGLPLGVHSWIFNASGALDGGTATMNLGGGGATAKPQINYHPPQGNESSVVNGTMTAGVWHCLQWEYNGSGSPPADTASLWVDGTLAANAPASKGWAFPVPWQSFDFGFTHYQVLNNPVDVFVDDFALDGAMVPCPP